MLDDIAELNQHIGLTGDRHLVPFSPIHIRMMEIGPFELEYLNRLGSYAQILEAYAQMGHAYTGVVSGKPVCCFGCIRLWPGVSEMWMLPSTGLRSVAMTFHRAAVRWLTVVMDEMELVRIQATVHTANRRALKWIESLNLECEGTLRAFGPEGADYKMYARLSDGRTFQLTETATAAARP